MARNSTVYTVLFDGRDDGPLGPAGDGTFIARFRKRTSAERFASDNTCYGRPAKVQTDENVPARLVERWSYQDWR